MSDLFFFFHVRIASGISEIANFQKYISPKLRHNMRNLKRK